MADDFEREKDNKDVVISDRRHARNSAEEAEAQAEVEDKPVAQDPGEVVEFKPPERESTPTAEEPAEQPSEPLAQRAEPPDDTPEAAQLRMLFEAGLSAYLHSQLQLLLNFAMIYMGRQPNPATGIVSTDVNKARLAIDLFDFIITRTSDDLPEQDRAGLTNLVAGLKMEFAQLAKGTAQPSDDEASD